MKIWTKIGLGVMLCFIFIGCADKTLKPIQIKIDGELTGAFELATEDYPIVKEGDEKSAVLKIKRTDVTLPYVANKVCAYGVRPEKDMMVQGGFGYVLYDAENNQILEVNPTDNHQTKQIKNLLALQPGEEGELIIKFDKKLNPTTVLVVSQATILNSGPLEFVGSIGKYAVKNFVAEFNFTKGYEEGKYQYKNSPAGAFLFFKGKNTPASTTSTENVWKISINEENQSGDWCGSYKGIIKLTRDSETSPYYYTMEGEFTNFRYDTYPYAISSKPIGTPIEN